MLQHKINPKVHKFMIYGVLIMICGFGFWMSISPEMQVNLLGIRIC